MEEIWKDVLDFENYQVSKQGDVKNKKTNRVLKYHFAGGRIQYKQVSLRKNKKTSYFFIHRLVWEAFNGPIPEGMVINHKDQDPSNNNLDNLMLCTQRENLLWGDAQERRVKNCAGKNSTKWVLKLNKNNEILHFYLSTRQAERETGVAHTSISSCCQGKLKVAGTVGGEKYIWKYSE